MSQHKSSAKVDDTSQSPLSGFRGQSLPGLLFAFELRLWVALCVTGLSYSGSRAVGLKPLPRVICLVFLLTLTLYNLDGSLDSAVRRQYSPRYTIRRRYHFILSGGALISAACLAPSLAPLTQLVTLLGLICCSFYALPLPAIGPLKNIPFLKSPFIGLAVTGGALAPPLAEATMLTKSATIGIAPLCCVTAAIAGYCTINATLFDFPDYREDTAQGTPTLPRLLGLRKTRRVCQWLALGTGALLTIAVLSTLQLDQDTAKIARIAQLSLLLLSPISFLAIRAVTPVTPRFVVAWLVDGALLVPSLCIFLYLSLR
ncbi:MAG: UbiA family prenyltransferase [Polyangiaceae bacterium]|nr:UbiA family prenyltransferase [Polyangiaceae bacterium]